MASESVVAKQSFTSSSETLIEINQEGGCCPEERGLQKSSRGTTEIGKICFLLSSKQTVVCNFFMVPGHQLGMTLPVKRESTAQQLSFE